MSDDTGGEDMQQINNGLQTEIKELQFRKTVILEDLRIFQLSATKYQKQKETEAGALKELAQQKQMVIVQIHSLLKDTDNLQHEVINLKEELDELNLKRETILADINLYEERRTELKRRRDRESRMTQRFSKQKEVLMDELYVLAKQLFDLQTSEVHPYL